MLYRSYAKARRHPSDSARRLTTKFGDEFNVDLSSFLEWHLWAFGSYEPHIADLFRQLILPGDRCIDVGANIGVHTVRLAKLVGAHGEVVALEPDEGLVCRIKDNMLLNRLTNVRIIQAAAAARGGDSLVLYQSDDQDANKARASLLPHSYLTGSATRVPTVSIDDIDQGPVALIKIDVEGYEEAVVSGAVRTISRYSPSIIFEYAPELLSSTSRSPFIWLQKSGYELFTIEQDRNSLTGRGRLKIERSRELPDKGTNILAISASMTSRTSLLARWPENSARIAVVNEYQKSNWI
jgi:FkbM family methyltransferase